MYVEKCHILIFSIDSSVSDSSIALHFVRWIAWFSFIGFRKCVGLCDSRSYIPQLISCMVKDDWTLNHLCMYENDTYLFLFFKSMVLTQSIYCSLSKTQLLFLLWVREQVKHQCHFERCHKMEFKHFTWGRLAHIITQSNNKIFISRLRPLWTERKVTFYSTKTSSAVLERKKNGI